MPNSQASPIMLPDDLRRTLSSGLLSFPVTESAADGAFVARRYAGRLAWLGPYGASVLFAAGGTGEFFSLAPSEHVDVVRTAIDARRGAVPIVAGAGSATRVAIECGHEAEWPGVAGIILLPHDLTEALQESVAAHVGAVCKAMRNDVIDYQKGQPGQQAGLRAG